MKKLFRCIRNWFFCKRYPFWAFRDFKTEKIDYSFTWYDDIPIGWREAFGKQLSKELLKVGKKILSKDKKLKWSDILCWAQIKEKYGELCLYASCTDELMKVLEKYELLSIGYCIMCGKPARYVTKGWIEYYCDECFDKYLDNVPEKERLKVRDESRLTKKDIPVLHTYHKTLSGKYIKRRVNIKKKYSIDFKQLWDL